MLASSVLSSPTWPRVTSCAPGLEQQLIDAGFTVEARHDYLVCSPDSLTVQVLPDGFELAEPATDAQRVGQVAVQNEAFGEQPVATPADITRLRRMQDNGGVVMQVRSTDGVCVAGGLATPPCAGVSEVAGIAVRREFRCRGYR